MIISKLPNFSFRVIINLLLSLLPLSFIAGNLIINLNITLIIIVSLILVGLFMKSNAMFYFFILIPIIHLFFYQIYTFDYKVSKSCLKVFKSNNFFGAIVLFNILIGKF